MAWYLDTSALTKLIIAEPESDALRRWLLDGERTVVSSDLARTELVRSVRRVDPGLTVLAKAVLDSIVLLQLSTAILERAALLDPSVLRSLDAVHLAAALEVGDDLEGFVAYDTRLADAAAVLGIDVVAPR